MSTIDRMRKSFSSIPGRPPRTWTRAVPPISKSPAVDRFAFAFTGMPPKKKEALPQEPIAAFPQRIIDMFL